MTVEFCYLIFITADYYVITYFIVPHFLQKRKYFYFIAATLVVIAFSAMLRALVAAQMNRYVFHSVHKTGFAGLYLNSAVNIFIWVQLIMIGKMIIDKTYNQQRLETLEKERMRNELDFLKAQVNPHALFNSLNTLYGHIDKSNQDARNILLQFSELLRYQLYDCTAEKICLEKETEYIRNYIAFQQWRKDKRLMVDVEIENKENGLKIAPLLLVVLIENTFKFVSNSTEKENKIIIKLCTKGTVLHSSFFNTTEQQQPLAMANSNGIGMANLHRRLELLYPHKYELNSSKRDDHYKTNLIIDLS